MAKGGVVSPTTLTPQEVDIAQKVAKYSALNVFGIDVATVESNSLIPGRPPAGTTLFLETSSLTELTIMERELHCNLARPIVQGFVRYLEQATRLGGSMPARGARMGEPDGFAMDIGFWPS
jgi:hypothetical protein